METPVQAKGADEQQEDLRSLEERFQEFIKTFKSPGGDYKYRDQLSRAHIVDERSLLVEFDDLLSGGYRDIAQALYEKPDEILPQLQHAAREQLAIEDSDYAGTVKDKLFHVRFRGLVEPYRVFLRKINVDHVGRMIAVDGIVVRASIVKGLVVKACYVCEKCHAEAYVEQKSEKLESPGVCAHCKGTMFSFAIEKSATINYQELKLQEKPESLPAGQLPRLLGIELVDDLVDTARPGDIVSATGVVRGKQEGASLRTKLRIFEPYLDGNFIEVRSKEASAVEITKEEEEEFQEMAKDPLIHRKLIASIAPSIYGNTDIKEGLLYQLVAGVPKTLIDGVKIRGEINVLLIGDPSVSKSQLLKYISKAATRGLYTSGRGSSAAGLSAAVIRDQSGMTLEAGACVLADRGICCIDEIDKMKADDRTALHEIMEQHTCSIAKGGIIATLNARTAILAAANPVAGRWNPYQNLADNIQMPVTLLSRFDLIFLMRDIPEPDSDKEMGTHIIGLHRKRSRASAMTLIPTEMLRKFVAYARRFEPVLSDEAEKILLDFYLKTRGLSADKESPISISARQLEALIRLSEARAKVMLKSVVTAEDAEAAIRLMTVVFAKVGVDVTTGKQDIDVIQTGIPKSQRDILTQMLTVLKELEDQSKDQTGVREDQRQDQIGIREAVLVETMVNDHKVDRDEARKILNVLKTQGKVYSPATGFVRRSE